MFPPHHGLEATHVINGQTCIFTGGVLINRNDVVTKSEIKQSTMVIWDTDKRTFTDQNELHNEKTMESMFEDTYFIALNLYQKLQAAIKNQKGTFDEADIQKSYA